MKIILAAAIYPPEIGGPAFYAASLKDALEREGHAVVVVTYGALKQYPSGLRHLLYAFTIWKRARGSDGIIAFDTLSAGVPAALANMFARVPLLVRIGGDFLWEHYVNRTRDLVPLPDFYLEHRAWSIKEMCVFMAGRFVLRRSVAVFSSQWQIRMWREPYQLQAGRVRVIENAMGPRIVSEKSTRTNFLFFTRQIPLKNADAFKRAFAEAKKTHPDIELDEGIAPHDELLERVRSCYAVVLPSISDITPNYILDAISFGKPFLLTKYSAYAEKFKDLGVIVDPLSVEDMQRGVETLCDQATYEQLREKLSARNETRTYDDIARECIAIIQKSV